MKWIRQLQPTGTFVGVAIFTLAAAIAYHAVAQRYDFGNLNGRQITRRDRLTGRVELCTAHGIEAPMTCAPAQ